MLFGSSGIRRIIDESSLKFFSDVSRAVGTFFNGGTICMGHDARNSSGRLNEIVKESILRTGVNVVDIGLVSTPVLAYTSQKFDGGVMITASHNPPEWNGIKIFKRTGLSMEEQKKVEEIYKSKKYNVGKGMESAMNPLPDYESAIKKFIESHAIPIRKDLRILLDPGNGAMSDIAKKVLSDLGMNVDVINDVPDGNFPNRPSEPKEETLGRAIELSKNYDFAACFDGDGDRVVFCDGQFFGYNEGMTAVAKFYGAKKIVTTVESGRLIDTVGDVIRVPVGDVNVAREVLRSGADIGVEQVGHYIFRDFGPFPETIIPIVIFASKFEEREFKRTFWFKKTSVHADDKFAAMEKLKMLRSLGKATFIDGIRVDFENGWALVRPSGTEPVIRIMVETDSPESTDEWLRKLEKNVRSVV